MAISNQTNPDGTFTTQIECPGCGKRFTETHPWGMARHAHPCEALGGAEAVCHMLPPDMDPRDVPAEYVVGRVTGINPDVVRKMMGAEELDRMVRSAGFPRRERSSLN